jgi:hypothetical protein
MGNVFKRLFNDDTFSIVEYSENETDQETLEKGENESLDKISLTDENREMIRTPTPIPTYSSLRDIMNKSLINNNHVEKNPNYLKPIAENYNVYTPTNTTSYQENITTTENTISDTTPILNSISHEIVF